MAIDLGVWPGGHYSVANGINNLGQIVGTGTVAGDNLDHALMWTVDDGSPTPTPTATATPRPTPSIQSIDEAHRPVAKGDFGMLATTPCHFSASS
jgi:probable HAF family extracellular repeat protein